MFIKQKLYWLVLFVVLSLQSFCQGADDVSVWEQVKLLSKSKPVAANQFVSGIKEELIAKTFVAQKHASVKTLIEVLRNKKLSKEARLAAVKMLSTLRAIEAINPLLEQLLLMPEKVDNKTPETLYPCYGALCQIGKPASRKALLLLQHEDKKMRKLLLRMVILQVEGKKITIFLVKAEIEKTKKAEERARLEAALKWYLEWEE